MHSGLRTPPNPRNMRAHLRAALVLHTAPPRTTSRCPGLYSAEPLTRLASVRRKGPPQRISRNLRVSTDGCLKPQSNARADGKCGPSDAQFSRTRSPWSPNVVPCLNLAGQLGRALEHAQTFGVTERDGHLVTRSSSADKSTIYGNKLTNYTSFKDFTYSISCIR